jgi:hypothetical protein
VPVALWGGLVADTKLPVLLLAAFLLGAVPPLILYRATRWRLRRRLEQTERSLSEARAIEQGLASPTEPLPPAALVVPPSVS